MSAGNFLRSKYQASYGDGTNIHPIRIQPELLDVDFPVLSNIEPDDPINNPISAIASLGNNATGLRPRFVTVKRNPSGSGIPGYAPESTIKITILKPDVWSSINIGDSVIYQGGDYEVISKTDENVV